MSKLDQFELNIKKEKLIRKILTNSLNTVSYVSKERDALINLITSEIMLKDSKKLWLNDLDEFLSKNKKTCLKCYSKYYYRDMYDKLYNPIYLKDYKPFLDEFIITVRQFKTESKTLLRRGKKTIKMYFLMKS